MSPSGEYQREKARHQCDNSDCFERVIGGQSRPSDRNEHIGEPPPCDCREVPGKAKSARRERCASKQLREIVSTEQPDQDVALSEVGVRDTCGQKKHGGEIKHPVRPKVAFSGATRAAGPLQRIVGRRLREHSRTRS